ncbi:hypothetical protein LWI29_000261 [Acer saccharum]|uniref:Uncharacterized protein n=1 Tax=Acer saccharum TaxID=4024 RepID=A0AA39VAE6_ACESA|nr:hypothetical protein LWI29_000261 [Acer saccharum]
MVDNINFKTVTVPDLIQLVHTGSYKAVSAEGFDERTKCRESSKSSRKFGKTPLFLGENKRSWGVLDLLSMSCFYQSTKCLPF